eukprot:350337-Chlamydomonas_euryale.AAC.8
MHAGAHSLQAHERMQVHIACRHVPWETQPNSALGVQPPLCRAVHRRKCEGFGPARVWENKGADGQRGVIVRLWACKEVGEERCSWLVRCRSGALGWQGLREKL